MSMFDGILPALHAAMDATFGDEFTLTPMLVKPSAKAVVDPDRAVYAFRGIFRAPGIIQGSNARNANESGRGVFFAGEQPMISIDDASALPSAPRRDDRVTGASLPHIYKITAVVPFARNGLRLMLAEA